MADLIKLVQGDTAPTVVVNLTDTLDDNAPINLAGCTVKMRFKAAEMEETIDTLIGVVLDGPTGLCKFDWGETTLAEVTDGLHLGEIEVTFPDGRVQTAFDPLRFLVRAEFI